MKSSLISVIAFSLLLEGEMISAGKMMAPQQKLRYSIETLWNGEPIPHPESPAVVELSTTCDGDLRMDFSAPLFNSPVVKEKLYSPNCPKQSFLQLWNYEVQNVQNPEISSI